MASETAATLPTTYHGTQCSWLLGTAPPLGLYPHNLFLLGVLVLLNHLVAVGELACAIWINSLGLFSHGSHMVFNGVILTGLLASVLANWEEHKRQGLRYVDLVARTNLALGFVLLCNAASVGYLSLRSAVSHPPTAVRCESLVYLVPVPALLLNLVAMYVIVHGGEEGLDHQGPSGPVSLEQRAHKRRSSEYARQHLMANALGSVGTIASTMCAQLLNWAVADTLCSGFVVVLMFVCAALLIREALEMGRAARETSVSPSYGKSGCSQLSVIFTM